MTATGNPNISLEALLKAVGYSPDYLGLASALIEENQDVFKFTNLKEGVNVMLW